MPYEPFLLGVGVVFNLLKFLTKSSPPDWNPQKQSPGQILDKIGVRGVLECCKGSEGSQTGAEQTQTRINLDNHVNVRDRKNNITFVA